MTRRLYDSFYNIRTRRCSSSNDPFFISRRNLIASAPTQPPSHLPISYQLPSHLHLHLHPHLHLHLPHNPPTLTLFKSLHFLHLPSRNPNFDSLPRPTIPSHQSTLPTPPSTPTRPTLTLSFCKCSQPPIIPSNSSNLPLIPASNP